MSHVIVVIIVSALLSYKRRHPSSNTVKKWYYMSYRWLYWIYCTNFTSGNLSPYFCLCKLTSIPKHGDDFHVLNTLWLLILFHEHKSMIKKNTNLDHIYTHKLTDNVPLLVNYYQKFNKSPSFTSQSFTPPLITLSYNLHSWFLPEFRLPRYPENSF